MGIDGTSGRRTATLAARLLLLALALFLVALLVPGTAAALSVGPQYGTGSSVSQKSSRDTNVVFSWLHPGNIGADDDATAKLGLPAASLGYEDWAGWYAELVAGGFDFSSIPDEALIDGVKVEIERAQFGAGSPLLRDNQVALTLGDPNVRSANRADKYSDWPTLSSMGTATYGGPSDLWGLDGLTAAQVKSPGFAVTMSVQNYWPLEETTLACVDYIRVTVYYSLPLTITARDQARDYGDEFDFTGTEFTVSRLQPGDSVSSVSFSCAGAAASATVAGSPYTITPSGATGTGLDDYIITYVPGEMTVTPRDLTITAADQTKPFGRVFSFTGGEFTAAGLVAGDSVTSATLASAGAAAGSATGAYPITVSDAVGTHLDDYAITYLPGTMTVGPSHSVGPFAKPLRSADRRVFKRGTVIRLMFRVTDQSGRRVTTLAPQLTVRRGAKVKQGPTIVRYSPEKCAYVYSLKTRGWPAGKYSAGVSVPTAPKSRSVTFTLTR